MEWLEKDAKIFANIPKKDIIFGKEEREHYNNQTKCWICEKEFNDNGNIKNNKVRDHCHFTGRYRGAAHNLRNLKYKKPDFIPVVVHNLAGYDSHLFIKELGFSEGDINCIPNNEEKYISFSKKIQVSTYTTKEGEIKPLHHQLRFIDSYKFMSTSLSSLVNNLPKGDFNNVKEEYGEKNLELLTRKGVYPYDYMETPEKLKETKLPPKEEFYSKLNDEGISDEDYSHAQRVWEAFKIKTLEDYHNLYNKLDVLLLADVFENFRNICIKNYELDPAHYYTAPGLAWEAALKTTDVKLGLLSDIDMFLMFEDGIRGGVSMVSNCYGKANNKYMGDSFDDTKPSKYITYLDANNLYGGAMRQPLPTHGFKWMNKNELETWEKHSCVLEVDLACPKHLHNLLNDYPLAPERIKVNKVDKLIPNLWNKRII